MNRNQVNGGIGDARDTIQDAGARAKARLKTAADRAQSLIVDTRATVEGRVHDKPLAALAAIAVVGLAAGLLLGGARRLGWAERRWGH